MFNLSINKFLNHRFALSFIYILSFLAISFITRSIFYIMSLPSMDFSILDTIMIFALGSFFDLGTAVFFILFYVLYVLIVPTKLVGTIVDKFLTYFILSFTLFITLFAFLGEFPFWEEFNTRYNFIAVDYLIYTYEVVENINQSYPLPILISGLIILCVALFYLFNKTGAVKGAFNAKLPLKMRFVYTLPFLVFPLFFTSFITNKQAEFSENTYVNELAKNGVYSFFAAYRSNELDYDLFYKTLPIKQAFKTIKQELKQETQSYSTNSDFNITRYTKSETLEKKPNIVLICIESLSADFLGTFGNTEHLSPNIDKLANKSVLFNKLYATGTRTVRGMEAIALSVPPTPGHSIVRRPGNMHLNSIASILKQKNYDLNFYYGGDGYFDNMNSFFGGQGFNIYDRNRGNPLSDKILTNRINIEDQEVSFENAWGICDEDIYNKLIRVSDENYKQNKSTFSFVMTSSNHRPYSFPEGKIDLQPGTRNAAVKYTDFALGQFFEEVKSKPWFENTVFVLIADHCASCAGKWEITINKHHIPAMIYNLPDNQAQKVDKLCSQIDIMPTLFGYLNWSYSSALYGEDISKMTSGEERALVGNYRTVGLLKNSVFTELNDKKEVKQYAWNSEKKEMKKLSVKDKLLIDLTISHYQTASYRLKKGLMKE